MNSSFNEYRNADYWTKKAIHKSHVRAVADRVAPYLVGLILFVAFASVEAIGDCI